MRDLVPFRNVMIAYVVIMALLLLFGYILSGCATHSGTVLFKGYQPPSVELGYRPNRRGPGIVKGYIFHDESYYMILKEEEKYNKITISQEEYHEKRTGDSHVSKEYVWNVEEWSKEKGEAVEQLLNMEAQGDPNND